MKLVLVIIVVFTALCKAQVQVDLRTAVLMKTMAGEQAASNGNAPGGTSPARRPIAIEFNTNTNSYYTMWLDYTGTSHTVTTFYKRSAYLATPSDFNSTNVYDPSYSVYAGSARGLMYTSFDPLTFFRVSNTSTNLEYTNIDANTLAVNESGWVTFSSSSTMFFPGKNAGGSSVYKVIFNGTAYTPQAVTKTGSVSSTLDAIYGNQIILDMPEATRLHRSSIMEYAVSYDSNQKTFRGVRMSSANSPTYLEWDLSDGTCVTTRPLTNNSYGWQPWSDVFLGAAEDGLYWIYDFANNQYKGYSLLYTCLDNCASAVVPTVSIASSVNVSCTASTLPSNTGFPNASDTSCPSVSSLSLSVTYQDTLNYSSLASCSGMNAASLRQQIDRRWTVTNMCGKTTSVTQRIYTNGVQTVMSSSSVPAVQECGTITHPTITDCRATYNLTWTGGLNGNLFFTYGPNATNCTATKIVRAENRSYNWVGCAQYQNIDTMYSVKSVSVSDNNSPVITLVGSEVNVTSCTLPSNTYTVSDTCDPNPTVTVVDTLVTDRYTNASGSNCYLNSTTSWAFSYLRVITATDWCGNVASKSQVLYVYDQTPPNFDLPATATCNCTDISGGNGQTSCCGTPMNFTDDCGMNPNPRSYYTFYSSPVNPASPPNCSISTFNRSVTVYDACGNPSTKYQVITLV